MTAANNIYDDFSLATKLKQFWISAAPEQRGRQPKGDSIPWGEVGEKTILATMAVAISQNIKNLRYPGLPFGSDLRFATDDALIHFDIKLTGPNDNPNEIVASPNQISGDGKGWDDTKKAVYNSPEEVKLNKAMSFQPYLPPFYILDGKILPCLSYFLKAVYLVKEFGDQSLDYLEIACVPNGLLLFETLDYNANVRNLVRPGKDEITKLKKRARIELDPLSTIGEWPRSIKIKKGVDGNWITEPRVQTEKPTKHRVKG